MGQFSDKFVDSHVGEWRCFYCGEIAGTVDHVVPRSMLRDLRVLGDAAVTAELIHRNRVMEVDCCLECNSRLGPAYSVNLSERRALLKRLLRKKYRRLLDMPDWDDAEIGRMGETLQQVILGRLAKRDVIRRRLLYDGPATLYGVRVVT